MTIKTKTMKPKQHKQHGNPVRSTLVLTSVVTQKIHEEREIAFADELGQQGDRIERVVAGLVEDHVATNMAEGKVTSSINIVLPPNLVEWQERFLGGPSDPDDYEAVRIVGASK
jgi:hypothetical protein